MKHKRPSRQEIETSNRQKVRKLLRKRGINPQRLGDYDALTLLAKLVAKEVQR